MRNPVPYVVLISLTLLVSCHQASDVAPQTGSAYIQYEPAIDGFRPLQDEVELTDYVFEGDDEIERSRWASDTNPNYVDTRKMADLVYRGKAQKATLRNAAGTPVLLRYGYHVITDGGPNPVAFWLEASDTPLIWVNSNYAYSKHHAAVNIILKNYPVNWNLKWWFIGSDLIDPSMTAEQLARLFQSDIDGADYDAGFTALSGRRSFRAPKGIGYLIVKTPADTYQVARIDVGQEESVTFTAP